MKDRSTRLAVVLCVVCALISAAACVMVGMRDAEHRSRYATAVETIEVMRQEWPNMDAAVQHHEEELERLRAEMKSLRQQALTLEGPR